MRLTTHGVLLMNTALSISYNPINGLTCAFLHGCTKDQQNQVRKQLEEFVQLAPHPLLIPVILVRMKRKMIAEQRIHIWNLLMKIEGQSGLTGLPPIQRPNPHPNRDNVTSFTNMVLEVIQLSGTSQSHAEALLLTLESIKSALQEIKCEPFKSFVEEATDILVERVNFMEHKTRVMLADLKYFEKRGQAQFSAVCTRTSLIFESPHF
jgi:hypothetical protein